MQKLIFQEGNAQGDETVIYKQHDLYVALENLLPGSQDLRGLQEVRICTVTLSFLCMFP